jgi:hypothetical protein
MQSIMNLMSSSAVIQAFASPCVIGSTSTSTSRSAPKGQRLQAPGRRRLRRQARSAQRRYREPVGVAQAGPVRLRPSERRLVRPREDDRSRSTSDGCTECSHGSRSGPASRRHQHELKSAANRSYVRPSTPSLLHGWNMDVMVSAILSVEKSEQTEARQIRSTTTRRSLSGLSRERLDARPRDGHRMRGPLHGKRRGRIDVLGAVTYDWYAVRRTLRSFGMIALLSSTASAP